MERLSVASEPPGVGRVPPRERTTPIAPAPRERQDPEARKRRPRRPPPEPEPAQEPEEGGKGSRVDIRA